MRKYRDLKKELSAEIRAFDDPAVFLDEIMEADWLFPWQRNTFIDFYRGGYKDLVCVVGQRCLHPETRILTADGTYKMVKDIKDGEVIYGLGLDNRITSGECFIYKNEGEKDIVEIETWTGKVLKLSHDHRVYTQRGLVSAAELKDDDYVYVPRSAKNGDVSDIDQAIVSGYIIGDFRDNTIKTVAPNSSSPIDRIPFTCVDIGVRRKDLRGKGIGLNEDCNLSIKKLIDIYNYGEHVIPDFLMPIVKMECFYDRVVRVEPCGKSVTYDVHVPAIGNFFAEDVLVKNSGKTIMSSFFAAYELFRLLVIGRPNTYWNMPLGSDIYIMNVATSAQQADDTIFSQIESRIDKCDWFKKWDFKKRMRSYEFITPECSIHIRSEHSNSSSLAGHTCLASTARVVTPSGYKSIADITPADKVHDIELEELVATADNGLRPCVRIKTSKGYTIDCTPDHKIMTYREIEKDTSGYGVYNDYAFEFMEAREAYERSVGGEDIYVPIHLGGAELLDNREFVCGNVRFPLNFDLGYILGYFIGDAEVFDIIYKSNEDMIWGFLSGLFDADGSFSSEYETNICTKSESFAHEIQDLLRLCGVCSKVYHNVSEDADYYTVRMSGNGLKVFKERATILKDPKKDIERKGLSFPKLPLLNTAHRDDHRDCFVGKSLYDKKCHDGIRGEGFYRYLDNDFYFDKIISMDEIGERRVYDLQVDSDRHEYTANGFKVHNCKIILLDEVARFVDSSGKSSAELVIDTLKRTTTTFGDDGKAIFISSPLYKDDPVMRLYRSGEKVDSVMTVRGATWELNPMISFKSLEAEFERKPEAAWRDYGAQPSESLESYFKEPDKIDLVIDHKIPVPPEEYVVPPLEPIKAPCFLAGDPAFKNDSFGIAMAYMNKKGKIVVPLAHKFVPRGYNVAEVDARRVTAFILRLIKEHNVVEFVTDIWNFPGALQEIREAGVDVGQNTVTKKEYDRLKELIYTGEIVMVNSTAIRELKELELVRGQKVDHPRSGSRDVSDAVANAVELCYKKRDELVEPLALVF